MTYGFHPEARLEYRAAAEFYESRQPGLGAAFTRQVEAAIERILEAPDRCRIIEQDVRRCLTHTFPYGSSIPSKTILSVSSLLPIVTANQDTGVIDSRFDHLLFKRQCRYRRFQFDEEETLK